MAGRRTYSPSNWVIIGSGNGLSPVRGQTVTWSNVGLSIVKSTPRNKFKWKLNQNTYFFWRKCMWKGGLENVSLPRIPIVDHWHHMASYIWVTIGLGSDLWSDGTKPLPAPLLASPPPVQFYSKCAWYAGKISFKSIFKCFYAFTRVQWVKLPTLYFHNVYVPSVTAVACPPTL